jgi:nucleoside-diphosphate-sugar epimerase
MIKLKKIKRLNKINPIIILGASGFVGTNICRYLSKMKFKFYKFNSSNLNLLNSKLTRQKFKNFNNYTLVIASAVISKNLNDKKNARKNITMIKNIISSIEEKKIKKIIFLSSTDVYGKNNKKRINEKTTLKPKTEYAKSKIISEKKLYKFCKNIPLIIIRIPGVYGFGDNFNSTVGHLIKQSYLYKTMLLNNNGQEKRDYIYIDDLCKIIIKLISKQFEGTVNIVSGKSISIKKISLSIAKISKILIKFCNFKSNKKTEHLLFDNKLLLSIFPNYRFTKLNFGIKKYIKQLKTKE